MVEFVDPSSQAGADLLGALDREIEALDLVVLRARTLMLIHATGSIEFAGRAAAELDQASVLLDRCSRERSLALDGARTQWDVNPTTANELVDAAPGEAGPLLSARFDRARSLVDEYMAVNETIQRLVEKRSEAVQRQRSDLDRAQRGDVTYRAK